jgi:predicted dehydrogenase/threonine dehydrogenase-like Zn-dependent dehydrogenase
MKQLLQNLRTGETLVAEVPVPHPKPGTALVHTAASLVSAGTERMVVEFAGKSLLGKARSRPDLVRQVIDKARREGLLTTLEAAFNRLDQPMPLGYSSAGTIVSLGEGMEGFQVGQRVACGGGGYAVHAEYSLVPRNLLAPLPEQVDFESAAFATLGAIALHGFRLAQPGLGERVAVIGLGLLGLLTVGIAAAAGCHVLGIDLDPERVKLAHRLGADTAVLRGEAVSAARRFGRGRGCDAVLICADTPSADPVELAGAIARDRAHVVAVGAVGLQLPRKVYFEKELSFINSRSYGPGRYDPSYEEGGHDYPIGYVRWTEGRNLEAFVDLLAAGRLDVQPLISHRIPIDRAAEAYQLITGKGKEPFLGVLLTYPQASADELHLSAGPDSRPASTSPLPAQILSAGAPPTAVRLGVLGAGNFATAVLLPALRDIPNLQLVAVASASGLSAENARARFGFRHARSDDGSGESILSDPEVNTVAILTRHGLHARQTLAALSAGKHVFCEKPLAIHPEELQAIERALQGENGIEAEPTRNHPPSTIARPLSPLPDPLLTVGFNRRFAPLAQRLRRFLEERHEPLLAHYRVNAGFLPGSHWLHDPDQGGGRLVGEGCHFIDFLTFLAGEPPVSVQAQALPDQGIYRADNFLLTFAFPDGSLGSLAYLANGDKAFPKERVEVFCGGRVAVLDDFRSLETVQDGRRQVHRSRLRQDKGHRAEWEAFTRAILAGGPPPIPYKDLLGVSQAAFAALEALRTGERVAI